MNDSNSVLVQYEINEHLGPIVSFQLQNSVEQRRWALLAEQLTELGADHASFSQRKPDVFFAWCRQADREQEHSRFAELTGLPESLFAQLEEEHRYSGSSPGSRAPARAYLVDLGEDARSWIDRLSERERAEYADGMASVGRAHSVKVDANGEVVAQITLCKAGLRDDIPLEMRVPDMKWGTRGYAPIAQVEVASLQARVSP